ncbi:MAG: lipoprotein [Gammaproteobacteria bacterium]|nr:lipoprotein [Gammaproteobacteria bacterium]
MKSFRRTAEFILMVLLVLSNSGCGQKGALYLPDKPEKIEQHGRI